MLLLGHGSLAANFTNDWFSRRTTTMGFLQLQHKPRCERTQHKTRIHTSGSQPPLVKKSGMTAV